ncbi:hypothetical protein [Kitasatospora griseola]|uniref:hypothetical protein n=1 Tax=Kitasatospora griseola TaxID=2064 RepID=UPI00381B8331
MSTNDHEDLSNALEVLVDRQPPAGDAPVAELVRRGRLRKRQRAAVMTGGVAAVVAVAMAGAFVVGAEGSPTAGGIGPAAAASGSAKPSSTPSDKASGSPSGKPSSSGSPSGKPTSSGSPSGKPSDAPTAGAPVPDLLAERIPVGYRILTTWKDPGPRPGSGQSWRLGAGHTITNGSRTGNIRIELTQLVGVPSGSTNYTPTADCGSMPDCTVTQRPDGSVLIVQLPAAAAGMQDWKALLYGTDGSLVTASSGTVPGPGDGTDLYPGPPVLDGEQLKALALDPVWQGIIKQH